METMVDNSHILNIGSGRGGLGKDEVRMFDARDLIEQFFPEVATFTMISRTVNNERIVEKLVIRCTHSTTMDHLLPGVKPTGKPLEIALVVIAGVKDDKISYEYIYWDQAALLAQLRMLDPSGLPIVTDSARQLLLYTNNI